MLDTERLFWESIDDGSWMSQAATEGVTTSPFEVQCSALLGSKVYALTPGRCRTFEGFDFDKEVHLLRSGRMLLLVDHHNKAHCYVSITRPEDREATVQ